MLESLSASRHVEGSQERKGKGPLPNTIRSTHGLTCALQNVTKGYSAVEVKVRNGEQSMKRALAACTDNGSDEQRPMGSRRFRHGRDRSDHLQQVGRHIQMGKLR